MSHKGLVSLRLYRMGPYADTTIKFMPGLNAIIGDTDAGKTTIFRDLRWLLFNHTEGDLITYGENHGFIEGTFTDGTVITRGKKKSTHYYILTKPDGTKTTFKGFGTKVPVDILEAHGIAPVVIDEKIVINLNFSSQLEPPFGLAFSPGLKAKVVGHLQGAHVIDGAIQEASTRRSRASQRLAEVQASKEDYTLKLNALPDVETVNERLTVLSHLLQELRVEDSNVEHISATVTSLLNVYRSKEQAMRVIEIEPALQEAGVLLAEINQAIAEHQSIRAIADLLDANSTETWKWTQYMDQADNVEELRLALADVIHDLEEHNELLIIHNRLEDVLRRIDTLEHLIQLSSIVTSTRGNLDNLEKDLRVYQEVWGLMQGYNEVTTRVSKGVKYIKDLEASKKQLSTDVSEALKLLEVCPVCGKEMGEEDICQRS